MRILQNKKLFLTVIFAAALLVRLSTMVVLETYRFENEDTFGFNWGKTAKHVALGEGFILGGYYDAGPAKPSAVAPPGYVYFIAFIFSLFGIYSVKSAIIIEILQALTAAFTCIVFYKLGKRFNETVGLVAALAMAFYPPSILFSVMRIHPLLLVVLLLALTIHYLFKIQESGRYRDALICGLLMGVNVLMEANVILFYVVGCVWLLYWSSAGRWIAVKCSLTMGLVCIICVLPWTIRNYIVFNAFVPVKSSMGWNLLVGNNPYGNGITYGPGSGIASVFSPEERAGFQQLSEIQIDRIMQRKAIEFIKADPKRFIRLSIQRMFYYWTPVNPYWTTRYETLRMITYGPVLVLALIGMFLSRRRWREASLFLALIASYPFFHYVTQVTIYRYRYLPEVFLIIFASYATVELVGRFGRLRSLAQAETTSVLER